MKSRNIWLFLLPDKYHANMKNKIAYWTQISIPTKMLPFILSTTCFKYTDLNLTRYQMVHPRLNRPVSTIAYLITKAQKWKDSVKQRSPFSGQRSLKPAYFNVFALIRHFSTLDLNCLRSRAYTSSLRKRVVNSDVKELLTIIIINGVDIDETSWTES